MNVLYYSPGRSALPERGGVPWTPPTHVAVEPGHLAIVPGALDDLFSPSELIIPYVK